ncbi:MAG: aminoacyl-tRNA hydrolase [Candidatus Omnitrophota bacterium]|nr:aminoacyl-tRNA hydrolase [Candidatus Omnitrophota bacterium]
MSPEYIFIIYDTTYEIRHTIYEKMKIIVGLGNPGLRYRNTRHNVGFLTLNILSKYYRLPVKKKGFSGRYGIGRIEQQEVMLFEPLTYMNLSGEAVNAVCSSRLDNKEDLLVITDDVNLPFGSIRLRQQGSSGGHNGLQSIIENIGPDFSRLRIGVGTDEEIEDMSAYVLSPFPRHQRAVLGDVLEKAARNAEIWLTMGIKEAMNRCNR